MGGRCPEGTLHAPHPADVTGCDRVSSPFRKGQLRFRNKHGKEKERRGGGSLYFHLLAKGRKGFSPQRSSSCTPRGQSVGGTAGDIHQGHKVLEGGADCDCRKEETAPPHGVPRDQEKETHVCGLPGAWRAQDPKTGGRGGPGLGGLCKMPGAELCRGGSRGGGSEPRQGVRDASGLHPGVPRAPRSRRHTGDEERPTEKREWGWTSSSPGPQGAGSTRALSQGPTGHGLFPPAMRGTLSSQAERRHAVSHAREQSGRRSPPCARFRQFTETRRLVSRLLNPPAS